LYAFVYGKRKATPLPAGGRHLTFKSCLETWHKSRWRVD